MSTLIRMLKDTSGLTSLEYGLIAVLIAVGLVVAFGVLGDHVAASYEDLSLEIDAAAGPN